MAGIYIHIPFCKKKCHYCNFYSLASTKYFEEVIDAIADEIIIRKDKSHDKIESIYFGGGTPSLLSQQHLEKILKNIYAHYTVDTDAEITLEANPDDMSRKKLTTWKHVGINRLSIGIQSFHDDELRFLNRPHTSQTALNCIDQAYHTGFQSLSIDLIYGIPGSTTTTWLHNLELLSRLHISHLSCYALTVEQNTAFDHFIRKGKIPAPTDNSFLEQFEMLIEYTNQHGFEHYEISNFCRDEKYALHNTNYWFGKPYLGFGPSAHSFDGAIRSWNIAHLTKYIAGVNSGKLNYEEENLSLTDHYNEFVMTRLRTMWGLNINELKRRFPARYQLHFNDILHRYDHSALLETSKARVKLSRKGIMLSDSIIADFFFTED